MISALGIDSGRMTSKPELTKVSSLALSDSNACKVKFATETYLIRLSSRATREGNNPHQTAFCRTTEYYLLVTLVPLTLGAAAG